MMKPCPCCGAAVAPLAVSIDPTGTVTFRGRSVHLSPGEAVILIALVEAFPDSIAHGDLYEVYSAGLDEPPQPETVKMRAWHLAEKLEPLGLEIESHHGSARSIRPGATSKAGDARCPVCERDVDEAAIHLDEGRGIATRGGTLVRLTPAHLSLLNILLARMPSTVSKVGLYTQYTGANLREYEPAPKIIDVQICKLRKAIAPLGLAILTRWGTGYALEAVEGSEAAVASLQARAFATSRSCRLKADRADRITIGQLRRAGFSEIQIAYKLRLTYRAVREALNELEANTATDADARTDAQVAALTVTGDALREAS